MSHYIEVETGLDEVKAALMAHGYHVVDMEQRIFPVNAVIYTGASGALQRTAKTGQDTILYNASGQTPDAVVEQLGQILS